MNRPLVSDNGVTRQMNDTEFEVYKSLTTEMPVPEKTAEERLAEVEEKLGILDIILGGG